MMMFILALTIPAAIAAWGSYHFSLRDPRSTSLIKIGFAGVLIGVFGVVFAILAWSPEILGKGFFTMLLGYLFWPMILLGAPLCIGSILGTAIGMYRSRER
ncbi:hypothetical protein [Bradyrhizobium sp. AZCC 1721]|uniref:hypothetical protein n=1 Tax=Bradyrhizobium sp. AZCC 1721 TaxID=3117016 RepID=UPI002FF02C1F